MAPSIPRREFLRALAAGGFAGVSGVITGCGTIFYPERRGQPAGPLDWKVVALDGIGLLFFFVPGVIAFAVDFSNGTIYLPPAEYGARAPKARYRQLEAITMPKGDLTVAGVEQAVSDHTGREVRLIPGEYRSEQLASLDQYWETRDKLAALDPPLAPGH